MAGVGLPPTFRKMVVKQLTSNFRKAVQIVTEPLKAPEAKQVIIKTSYAGVNASDVNISAGRYSPNAQIPFDAGFEGMGEVVAVGPEVKSLKLHQPVAYMSASAYADYVYLTEREAFPVPKINPDYVSLLVSGLTASIGLDLVGEIKKNEVVLITAAAGGLGQIAVQWAKKAGCEVVGTCSNPEKETFLKNLGCSHVINYKKENLDQTIKAKYPKGLDVVWETLGGQAFETLSNRLAIKGRLVVIGATTGYKSEGILPPVDTGHLPIKLLGKSASIRGFFIPHFVPHFPSYFARLNDLLTSGELKITTDDGTASEGGPFRGLEDVYRAVDHLQSGRNMGKVVVQFP